MNNTKEQEADIQKRLCQTQYPLGVLLIEKEALEEVENWFKKETDLFYTMEFEQRWNNFKKQLEKKE